jgi:hypothetical protein
LAITVSVSVSVSVSGGVVGIIAIAVTVATQLLALEQVVEALAVHLVGIRLGLTISVAVSR